MAQQAQRSSVELFTQLYFKGKTIETDAYIIKTMASGAVLLIPAYGIEGMVPLPAARLRPGISFDATHSHFMDSESGATVLGLFQHVQIRIRTETHEVSQRDKICIELINPDITLSSDASDGTPPKRTKSS